MAGFSPALALYRGLTRVAPALPEALARRAHRAQGADPARLCERVPGHGAPDPDLPEVGVIGRASAPQDAGANGPDGRQNGGQNGGQLVWIHAASVGEVAGVAGIASDLAAAGLSIVLTTFTASGAAAAAQLVPAARHRFLPADSRRAARAFLGRWRPDLAVFTESDLWPNLIDAVASAGIPLALVNARASRTRRAWPRLSAALLAPFAAITTQDAAVRDDLLAIGLDPARIVATGDPKAGAAPLPADPAALARLRAQIGPRPVWVAASTHDGDEAAVLAAQRIARAAHPHLLLIVVPRHPARGVAIAAAAGGQAPLRSRNQGPGPADPIWIADTLGETGLFYRLAPLVFLGGSFGPEGGHNPYEPAALGAAVLTGPGIAHQAGAFAGLAAAGAARQVAGGADLGATVAQLIGSPALRAMGVAALAHLARGSAARPATVAILRALLDRGPATGPGPGTGTGTGP